MPVWVPVHHNLQAMILPWSDLLNIVILCFSLMKNKYSLEMWAEILNCFRFNIWSGLVYLTFISSTICLYIESFKSVLRLKAQQMPESVMAGLNNSEQFLVRPWNLGNRSHWKELSVILELHISYHTCQEQERSMWGDVIEGKQGSAERQRRRNIPG